MAKLTRETKDGIYSLMLTPFFEDRTIDYDTYEEALFETSKVHELGTFLIQECTEGDSAYTQTFHSRVIFV